VISGHKKKYLVSKEPRVGEADMWGRLIVGFLSGRQGFSTKTDHVGFVVDSMSMGKLSLSALIYHSIKALASGIWQRMGQSDAVVRQPATRDSETRNNLSQIKI
jgi:hypothetical protein